VIVSSTVAAQRFAHGILIDTAEITLALAYRQLSQEGSAVSEISPP
jgi:hypothetical protein